MRSDVTSDGHFIGWHLSIGAETRTVTAWNRATYTFTVSPGFSTVPAAGASVTIDNDSYWVTCWMQDFITSSWGYAKDLALGMPTTAQNQLDRLFTWKAQSIIKRLGLTGANEFLYRDYGVFYLPIAPTNNPNWIDGSGPWYHNAGNGWGDIYNETYSGTAGTDTSTAAYASLGAKVEGAIRTSSWIQSSGTIAPIPAIAYAVRHGVAGAEAAWQRLTTASNWPAFAAQFEAEPVWAVAPGVFRR
jgi:hypothetical protein